MNIDIQNMPDNEIITLHDKLSKEIETRKRQKQEQAWAMVRMAVATYIEKYGPINVDNDIYIDEHYDLSTFGEIFSSD